MSRNSSTAEDKADQPQIFDRTGKTARQVGPPREYQAAVPSPDFSKVALSSVDAGRKTVTIEIVDQANGSVQQLLVAPAPTRRMNPVWSPDGKKVAFGDPVTVQLVIGFKWTTGNCRLLNSAVQRNELCGVVMKRVFVSYSRSNLEVVTQLVQDIQAAGVDPWHDQTLTGGQRWWDNILSNIRECDVFISALSPESWDSEACKSELRYAVQLSRTILPVLVADGINVNLLPAPLNEIQVTDYRQRDKGAAFALIKCILTASGNPPLPDPLPPPPHVPISYLSNLTERVDSKEPLDAQSQITLLFELEGGLREGRSPVEIRDLLLRLKRRDDLLAKVAVKIDAALRTVEERLNTSAPAGLAFGAAAPATQRPTIGFTNTQGSQGQRICGNCKEASDPGSRFCRQCGAPLQEQSASNATPPRAEVHAPEIARSKSRRYLCNGPDSTRVINEVKQWLDAQGFDSQQMPTETGSVLLQFKKRGGWRDFVGMATSLNVVFHQAADTLTVEVGAGKWIDKAAAGAVSMLVLWPLAVTAGIGAWEQSKLPDKIFEYIDNRLVHR